MALVEDSALAALLYSELARADKMISIAMYLCTLDVRARPDNLARRTIKAIVSAAKRGVNVRVLLASPANPRLVRLNRIAATYMSDRGVAIRMQSEVQLHSKFVVIDGGFCTVGSHNITQRSFEQNSELTLAVWGAETVASIQKTFDSLWHEATS